MENLSHDFSERKKIRMAKEKICKIPFAGTAEQEAKLHELTSRLKDQPGALMPVMQQAQEIYGYLPIEVQRMIADDLGIAIEEVYEVATFYTQFALNPKGQYKIGVCLGTACYVKGAQEVYDKVCSELGLQSGEVTPDGKFSLEATRCIGCCGLAPVMTVNDDVYGKLTADQIPDILKKY